MNTAEKIGMAILVIGYLMFVIFVFSTGNDNMFLCQNHAESQINVSGNNFECSLSYPESNCKIYSEFGELIDERTFNCKFKNAEGETT